MKKVFRIAALTLVFCLLLSVFAFADNSYGVTLGMAYFNDVKRVLTVGESPDLTKGYIDFSFENGESERVLLADSRLPAFPATDTAGYLPYRFEIYGANVKLDFVVVDLSLSVRRFKDINPQFWGYRQIRNVVAAGFFKGVSATAFAPEMQMTRAEFCQMLYNIYQNDASVMTGGATVQFQDVPSSAWYYNAVTQCAKAGIVNGVGSGLFAPDQPIKRQEAAVMMMRIIKGKALDKVNVDSLLSAARRQGIAAGDFDSAGAYARPALAAALGLLFFGNENGDILPLKSITRAECAAMISNYFFGTYALPAEEGRVVYLSPENRANQYTGVAANERDEMYKVANKIKSNLETQGYTVYIADVDLSIRESADGTGRYLEAQALGADIYIALHTNATTGGNSGGANGTQCYYNGNNKGAKELAEFIYLRLSALKNDKGFIQNDMLTEKPYAEVRLPTMANVLCEVQYHDYAPYALWITTHTDEIAGAFCDAINDYFNWLEE